MPTRGPTAGYRRPRALLPRVLHPAHRGSGRALRRRDRPQQSPGPRHHVRRVAHVAYPDRFVGCAMLPMQDPLRALEELDRAAGLPGIRGVYMGTNVSGRELSDPEFLPIFERAAALRLPVLLHPLRVVGAERLQPFYLGNLLGNPFDTAIAAAHLVFGGVLDRLPKLEVCLPHAGGALPYLHGRLRHGQRVRPEAQKRAKKPFSSYLRRFTYDIISHDPGALRYLV